MIDFEQVINDVSEDMGKHNTKVLREAIKHLLEESVKDRAKFLHLKDKTITYLLKITADICNIK